MARNPDKTSPTKNEMLKAWYADSLGLISHKSPISTPDQLQANPLTLEPSLGIVLVSIDGDELWEDGNSQACRSYINRKNIRKIVKSGMLVEKIKDGLIIATCSNEIVRIIFVHHDSLAGILNRINPGIELSNSEFHLLTQILCGMSLKEASVADHVSYETKRSQFKSLGARTGFRTQSEVIRNTLLALVSYALDCVGNVSLTPPAIPDDTEAFLNLYYPGIFRFHQIATNNGRKLRVAETGPLNGTPVLWLHSQTLPSPGQFNTDWITQTNVRLIIPLREGFLGDEKRKYQRQQHLDRCTEDIAGTIEFFCNGRARIVANSSSAPYAINLAVNYREYVERLTFCSAAYVGNYSNQPVHRLVRGVKNLISTNEILIANMFERYMSKMSTVAGTLEVLKSSYDKSPRDMEIFTDLLSNPVGHSWMYESYRMSRHSVIMDVAMGSFDVWQHAHKINCPVLFVHGRTDPINLVADARNKADRILTSKFVELEKDGQSLFIDRLAELVSM